MDIVYEFVPYGEPFEPLPGSIVLDVGMRTVPGVIDHHHPDAEPECTASLLVKHPELVLDHLGPYRSGTQQTGRPALRIITHRLPDFDALASIFLTLELLKKGGVDSSMQKLARYTRLVDSASLPERIDLSATPYSILRALFSGPRKDESEINRMRVAEGLKFMNFLYSKAEEGYEIEENRLLYSGIDRYLRAMRKVENDYFHYLDDLQRGNKLVLNLPRLERTGHRPVDALIIRNPTSFLLKEWARRDRAHSSLGKGFSLLVTGFGSQRYILGVDPVRGVNLRGLGGMLNEREHLKRAHNADSSRPCWYEGNCPFFNYRIIDSPQEGTLLSDQDLIDCLMSFSRNISGAG
jgi:hypothetical protein